jgi:hypothetical protein
MSELLPQIIFGWPFIIASLILSIVGVAAKLPKYLVAGAMFLMPPSLYMSGYPAIRWLALLLPFCILGAAYLVQRNKVGIAWLLLIPPVGASLWLAYLVMEQYRNLS